MTEPREALAALLHEAAIGCVMGVWLDCPSEYHARQADALIAAGVHLGDEGLREALDRAAQHNHEEGGHQGYAGPTLYPDCADPWCREARAALRSPREPGGLPMTKPRTLRLTGQQIDSIQPPVPDAWLIDFDEYEDFIIAPAAGVHLGDEGLRAALATIDANVAAYATQEANSAERHDWSRADRFRYLAMGNAEAVETIRAALAAQENPA